MSLHTLKQETTNIVFILLLLLNCFRCSVCHSSRPQSIQKKKRATFLTSCSTCPYKNKLLLSFSLISAWWAIIFKSIQTFKTILHIHVALKSTYPKGSPTTSKATSSVSASANISSKAKEVKHLKMPCPKTIKGFNFNTWGLN